MSQSVDEKGAAVSQDSIKHQLKASEYGNYGELSLELSV
jgi:hypothetical protein